MTLLISIIRSVEGEPGVADEEYSEVAEHGEFMGHIVDRSVANVFIDFFQQNVEQVLPMEHHMLDGTRGDGWHFWVAPGGVLLVTVRERGVAHHYPLVGVRRCLVLPKQGGDPLDPFAPAQPICEYDSEVIEDVTKLEQELIVDDAAEGVVRPVFFHNKECLGHWKEEQGGEKPTQEPGAGTES